MEWVALFKGFAVSECLLAEMFFLQAKVVVQDLALVDAASA